MPRNCKSQEIIAGRLFVSGLYSSVACHIVVSVFVIDYVY